MATEPVKLIACHDCDLLQREITLKPGCTATCRRCGAVLYRRATDSINRTLAFTVAASVFFLIANIFPIFAIRAQGDVSAITLFESVQSLWKQGMKPVSTVVFLTAIVAPAVELGSMSYLLFPLKRGRLPRGYVFLMQTLRYVQPWGMIEVLMLGVLVSIVKLTQNFKVIPGVALWSFGVLTLLLAAVAACFSPRDVWERLEAGEQARVRGGGDAGRELEPGDKTRPAHG
ncbi:paraquat-inducible protein [Geomonas sp. Red276]